MAQAAIEKIDVCETTSPPVFAHVRDLFEKVRHRAFERFQKRAGGAGSPYEHWLAAERELFWVPPSDLDKLTAKPNEGISRASAVKMAAVVSATKDKKAAAA